MGVLVLSLLRKLRQTCNRLTSSLIRLIVPIKKGRVLCESFGGLQYACNPKYLTEFLLANHPNEFHISWLFADPKRIGAVDERIKIIKKRSFKELFYINTSEFIVTNVRWNDLGWGWKKRKGQKYIMTWHGSMALKRIEFDAVDGLPISYLAQAEEDSKRIDLIPSDSVWCTSLLRRAFHYNGQVLEGGVPRNDVLLQSERVSQIRNIVRSYFQIDENKRILLYAPTFRSDKRMDSYLKQWDSILPGLRLRFGQCFVILVRLHPNMMKVVETFPLLEGDSVIDATQYDDMQELLCAADVLITDYSSTMFEMGLMNKPCFLYVTDADTYDRGFYFRLEELPFPIARNIKELKDQIESFNDALYTQGLHHLYRDIFRSYQKANSCRELASWMRMNSI